MCLLELNTDYGAWIEYLPRGFMTRLNSEVLFVDRAQERVKAMDILRRIAQENNLEGRKAAFVLMCAVDEWALSAPTYFADLAKRSFEGVEEHNSRVNKPQHSKSVDNMRPSPSDSPHRTSHAGHKPAQG